MRSLRNGFMATLVFVSLVTAQGVRATVVGRVTDDTGAVVPGAKITITNVGTNDSRSVIVNDSGEYAVPQLAPGQYTVTAEYAGFNKVVRSGIVLETGQGKGKSAHPKPIPGGVSPLGIFIHISQLSRRQLPCKALANHRRSRIPRASSH